MVTANNVSARMVRAWFHLITMIVVFFAVVVSGQNIQKQLKAARKADKNLEWRAAELYQMVLDNPSFQSLSLPDKLRVYDSLGWHYYVTEKYERAEISSTEAVRLRNNRTITELVKKEDRDYVSNESRWYTQALHRLAKTKLALEKFTEAQDSFRQAIEAYEKFNQPGDNFLKWELLVGMGQSYYRGGNFEAAIPFYESAFELRMQGYQANYLIYETHFMTAEAKCELANIYRDKGDITKAETLYLKAIAIMDNNPSYSRKNVKDWDEVRIMNYIGYAKLLRIQGKHSEADVFEAKAKELQKVYK